LTGHKISVPLGETGCLSTQGHGPASGEPIFEFMPSFKYDGLAQDPSNIGLHRPAFGRLVKLNVRGSATREGNMSDRPGKVVFLNGASSSGKTTIAKRLQGALQNPYLHVSLDMFLHQLPVSFLEDAALARELPRLLAGSMHRVLRLPAPGTTSSRTRSCRSPPGLRRAPWPSKVWESCLSQSAARWQLSRAAKRRAVIVRRAWLAINAIGFTLTAHTISR
jgi:hypothetical protein